MTPESTGSDESLAARWATGDVGTPTSEPSPLRSMVSRWLIGIVMVVLTLAWLAKAWDVSEFRASLLKWPVMSGDAARFISLAVPQLELLVGGCWVFGIQRRLAAWVAAVLLVLFSVVLMAQLWWLGSLPPCNCFGRLLLLRSLSDQGAFAVVRNGVLLGVLLTGLWFSRHDAR